MTPGSPEIEVFSSTKVMDTDTIAYPPFFCDALVFANNLIELDVSVHSITATTAVQLLLP